MSYERSIERFLLETAEKGRVIGPSGDSSCCVSGERFVTITDRVKPEGEMSVVFDSSAEARDAWLKAFVEYSGGKDDWVLMWRHKPSLEFYPASPDEVPPVEKSGWIVWSRLVLVDSREHHHE